MNAVISRRILALVAAGVPVLDACRAILGHAAIDAMIADVYETLRATR